MFRLVLTSNDNTSHMLKLAFFLTLLIFCDNLQAQDSNCSCSEAFKKVGYFWKRDSLANNGYRYIMYRELLTCDIDTVFLNDALTLLGKPSVSVEFSYKGILDLRYIYYNSDAMDSTWRGPHGVDIVILSFDLKTKLLKRIVRGGS